MKNYNLLVASDGSVLHGKAAHTFCLATKDDHTILTLNGAPVDDHPDHITSSCPEAFGALAVITLVNLFQDCHDMHDLNV